MKSVDLKVGTINIYMRSEYLLGCAVVSCMRQCISLWGLSVRLSGLRFSVWDVIPWPLLVGVHGGAPSV